MKKILFIVPYPVGAAPSQRFRFEQYFEILTADDFKFDVEPFWTEKGWEALYNKKKVAVKIMAFAIGILRRIVLLFRIRNYDQIFLHREALPIGPPIIEYFIARVLKRSIIYDFDDAIWLPNTSNQNRIAAIVKYHRKVNKICSWSRKISCGNEFLATYARQYNKQVIVNPTTIDLNYHTPRAKSGTEKAITIGWTGTHSTTKYLKSIAHIIKEIQKLYPVNVLVISNQKPEWDLEKYTFLKWNKDKEIEQLLGIDIGIMPLNDSIWEQGKCGFKALQYMALEIPAVVSNVGVNKRIIEHGLDGFLCSSEEDWRTYLIELVSSSDKRRTMGVKGREKIRAHYSSKSNASRFLGLFA